MILCEAPMRVSRDWIGDLLVVSSLEPLVVVLDPFSSPLLLEGLVVGFGFGTIGFGVVDSRDESVVLDSADPKV